MKKVNTLLYTLLAGIMSLFATGASAQTWNFSTMSDADKAACQADANWLLGAERWCYVGGALENAPLMANGSELAYAKGLTFTAGAPSDKQEGKAKVRCSYGDSRLELNGKGISLTIPNLKAGQVVKVSCMTGKKGEARGLDATNLSGTQGFGESAVSAEEQTCSGTVAADGDVTITTIVGGMYIYSISVSDAQQGGGEVTPPAPSDDHSVSLNTAVNQMRLTVGKDIKYYNTDDVKVAFDKAAGNVVVTPVEGDWQDVYTRTVSHIDFTLAQASAGDGEIQDGAIKITEAKGWQESLYAKWEKYSGAESYNVYVKGGQYSDWTKIDQQLVRDYGSYARADAVGLVAGTYGIKVVAVDADGKEIESSATEADNMDVVNYSREGFAHFNRTEGVGAYNNDGSLKAGAKVLYITKNTAKTVKTTVKQGKNDVECTGMQAIIAAYQKGDDTTPIAFRIIGKIDADDMDDLGSSAEGLQIKGKGSYSTLNITIEGIGDDATIYGFGFLLRNASSVELRNFAILRCMDDALSLDTDNSNIWLHNLDLFYGQKGGAADQAKGDGTVDIKGDSKYVTVDNIHFWDSGKASMCGMTSESGPNYITYHNNWFDHSDSRHPRIRTMSVHLYNNYFDHNDVYGVGVTTGASCFVDRNYFKDAYRPMMSSKQGTDAKGEGTFSGEDGGIIKAYGNIMNNPTSNYSYIPYSENSTSFDAYEVSSPDETVPSSVKTLVGGNSYDNFDTNPSLMYDYTAVDASDVPAKVTGYYGAGRLNHGDIVYTIPNETVVNKGHHQPLPELANIIDSYKSSLVGIYGDENASSGEQGSEGGEQGGDEPVNPNPGGDEGDEPETPVVTEGDIYADFVGAKANSNVEGFFTVAGSEAKNHGGITVNGQTYETGLKLDSKGSLSFTPSEDMTMTLYFRVKGDHETTITDGDVKVNGENVAGTYIADGGGFALTMDVKANTAYEIGKGSSESYIFYIILSSKNEGGEVVDPNPGEGGEEPVDPTPGDDDDQPTEPASAVSSSFVDGVASNNFFTTSGSKATKKGSMTINGETYETGLKLDSKGSITFTPTSDMTMTVYYRVKEGKESTPNLNLNGNEVVGTAVADGFTYTATVGANTSYTIAKADVEIYVYYIELVPVE